MHAGRRLLGLALGALGVLGVVVCLAGVAGVWIIGSRVQQVNAEVFRQADELLVQVDRRAAQACDAVVGTRELVDELKQTLRDSAAALAAERVAERVVSLPEIDDLERRLASAMERADGLVQVSASTAELIKQLLATLGVIAAREERGSERRVRTDGDHPIDTRIARQCLANVWRMCSGFWPRFIRNGT